MKLHFLGRCLMSSFVRISDALPRVISRPKCGFCLRQFEFVFITHTKYRNNDFIRDSHYSAPVYRHFIYILLIALSSFVPISNRRQQQYCIYWGEMWLEVPTWNRQASIHWDVLGFWIDPLQTTTKAIISKCNLFAFPTESIISNIFNVLDYLLYYTSSLHCSCLNICVCRRSKQSCCRLIGLSKTGRSRVVAEWI